MGRRLDEDGCCLPPIATSIVLTWLYNSTNGSLLLVVICHAAYHTAGMFLPVANTVSSENLGAYITIFTRDLGI